VTEVLLADFGSTFVKIRVVTPDRGELLAAAQAPTSLAGGLDGSLAAAVRRLPAPWRDRPPALLRACSSAAGGLRMVAIGLTRGLTVEAARRACLGAGAKLAGAYAFELSAGEMAEIVAADPVVLLLVGGIDGGDRRVAVHNAGVIAASDFAGVTVYAGNGKAADEVGEILGRTGKQVMVADNVMPAVGRLAIESCRQAIRQVFVRHITGHGHFTDPDLAGRVVLPTPLAVLQGLATLAGDGPVLAVDVGGATTDVHSVGESGADPGVVVVGLPEPRLKRTVEGDIGLRSGSAGVVHAVERDQRLARWCGGLGVAELRAASDHYQHAPAAVAAGDAGRTVDHALASVATAVAVERHVGHLSTRQSVAGGIRVQEGKNLGGVTELVGTGGIFAGGGAGADVLAAALAGPEWPESLRPVAPTLSVDAGYCLFAAGLLADLSPGAARALARSSLVPVG
jgi:uncharacterized protein (TIGR01319 family)